MFKVDIKDTQKHQTYISWVISLFKPNTWEVAICFKNGREIRFNLVWLTFVFAILKISEIVSWSWTTVFMPMYVGIFFIGLSLFLVNKFKNAKHK